MKRSVLLVSLCALFVALSQCGLAQSRAVSGPERVSFKSGGETVHGVLYRPSGAGPFPAIVVIHEWWGLNSWVKKQAVALASHAYVVLALDLYQGKVAKVASQARNLKRALPTDRAIGELKAAFAYLAGRLDVDPKRIGALGWSMGGGLALRLAIHEPRLAACVVNYGSLPTKRADIRQINAQTLGIFGARDRGISPIKVRAFEKSMNAAKKSVEIKTYDDAGHAFENPANVHGYRPQAANDAWLRTLMFLGRSL